MNKKIEKYYQNIPTFWNSMSNNYAFNLNYATNNNNWNLVKNLYEKNLVYNEAVNIPKKIHQIWLGSPIPDKYKKLCDMWKEKHPDWEYKLWTDEDVESLDMINIEQFNLARNFGMKSDIMRYEILYKFGGLYVDTDFEPLDEFIYFNYLDFFAGIIYNQNVEIGIGIIGTTPKNKIIEKCIFEMKKHVKDDSWLDIFYSTGPYFFTDIFFKHTTINDNYVVFPSSFFYSFPNSDRHINERSQINKFLKNESIALHYWYASWLGI